MITVVQISFLSLPMTCLLRPNLPVSDLPIAMCYLYHKELCQFPDQRERFKGFCLNLLMAQENVTCLVLPLKSLNKCPLIPKSHMKAASSFLFCLVRSHTALGLCWYSYFLNSLSLVLTIIWHPSIILYKTSRLALLQEVTY